MKRILPIVAVLAGCATVQVTPLNVPPRSMAPRDISTVKLFVTKAPDAPYDEVFLIRSDAPNSDQALEAMREKGAELGCDAIVIAGAADRVVGTPDGRGNTSVSMREGFLGSCILFR